MGITDRWLKKGVETPRCPMCKTLLKEYGDEVNFITKQKFKIYTCDNCPYERRKLIPWD